MNKKSLFFLCFFLSFINLNAAVNNLKFDTISRFIVKRNPLTLVGLASYYSHSLHGSKTANGERYHKHKMTAASNLLPINSKVIVYNLKNNDSVIVRINDRMSPKMLNKKRIIDLSYTAAKKLKFLKQGLLMVKVVKIADK